jgi:hypothetical protein
VRHVRMLGLCLVALFALTAVAAVGSASAANPEWGACIEAKKGHYEDSSCTKEKFKESKGVKKYSGKYEWKAGAPAAPECIAKKHGNYLTSACNTEKEKKGVPEEGKGKYEKDGPKFTGKGGAGVLKGYLYGCALNNEFPGGFNGQPGDRVPHVNCKNSEYGLNGQLAANIECATENATGEAVGSKEIANVKVVFTGCQFNGNPSTTPGHPAGEIVTYTLKGHLGYINKSTTSVGVLLEPAAAGGAFAEFEIVGVSTTPTIEFVGGGNATEGAFYEEANGSPNGGDGVISPIVPVDAMTHTFTQHYTAETTQPYLPVSCPIANTCPLGSEDGFEDGKGNADYVNVPSHFEGGPLEVLEVYQENLGNHNTSAWSPAAEEITNVNTLEGEAEIKA